MKKQPRFQTGDWWRFSRYRIHQGFIVPEKGAKLEFYNPWDEFYELKGKREPKQPPYESLLKLYRSLYVGEVWQSPYPVAKELEHLVTDWCNQNGLLGILLEYVHSINLYPAHRPVEPDGEYEVIGAYDRRGAHWKLGDHTGPLTSTQHEVPYIIIENFVDHTAVVDGGLDFDLVIEPVTKTWRYFFPQLPKSRVKSYKYPFPGEADFYSYYGEPLAIFLQFVRIFYSAAMSLTRNDSEPWVAETYRTLAGRNLGHLTAQVSVCLERQQDGSFRQRWKAPSLLSAYAQMLHLDMLGGRRVIHCSECNAPSISASYQAAYCSQTCRSTAQKRRLRERMKKALRLRSEGLSPAAISKRLRVNPKVLSGWLQGGRHQR